MGRISILKIFLRLLFVSKNKILANKIAGIDFNSPIGLAAGFDYNAMLPNILGSFGFGFETIGTITYSAYSGNPPPILGRLPKSKSLMVNKGFKNIGAKGIIKKISNSNFDIPIGISIGRTNSRELATQDECIKDICKTFRLFENSTVKHSYYELNISCPNLYGDVTFYPPKNLSALLTEVDKINLSKPVFIKMPIEKTDNEVLKMLDVIIKHNITGVVFGNLQKDRKHKTLDKYEISKFPHGNFSGKPTFERSNELISLTYKHFKDKLIIIGCGGVFSAEDAYEKIKRGASLVQLITGLVYEGPQFTAEINLGLTDILKKKGFKHLRDAIGSAS